MQKWESHATFIWSIVETTSGIIHTVLAAYLRNDVSVLETAFRRFTRWVSFGKIFNLDSMDTQELFIS